ncbi:hypothetical protein HMPREF1557_01925 [Streptococcus sobrinus W1703]|uniref:Uncharacterized protein n=1 Tax=Streptococcus sobrinus W1703 TaxID=1227275 RepID=U2IJE9_9STRE|nr:hypothetical protein HMPREF1557_01925 [Streptococcus sobrinus W1703]
MPFILPVFLIYLLLGLAASQGQFDSNLELKFVLCKKKLGLS